MLWRIYDENGLFIGGWGESVSLLSNILQVEPAAAAKITVGMKLRIEERSKKLTWDIEILEHLKDCTYSFKKLQEIERIRRF